MIDDRALLPRGLLNEGVLLERVGSMTRALRCYRTAADRSSEPALRAEAIRRVSDVQRAQCDWRRALESARDSRRVAKATGRVQLIADALNAEAATHMSRGDFAAAIPLFEDMLRRTSLARVRGLALQNLGSIAAMEHDFTASRRFFLDSFRSFRAADYERGAAIATLNYGATTVVQGEHELAEVICEQAIDRVRGVHDRELLALALKNHAEALAGQSKKLKAAETQLVPVIGFFTMAGNRYRKVQCLCLLGDIRVQQNETAEAVRAYGRAMDLAQEIGAKTEISRIRQRMTTLGAGPADVAGETAVTNT